MSNALVEAALGVGCITCCPFALAQARGSRGDGAGATIVLIPLASTCCLHMSLPSHQPGPSLVLRQEMRADIRRQHTLMCARESRKHGRLQS